MKSNGKNENVKNAMGIDYASEQLHSVLSLPVQQVSIPEPRLVSLEALEQMSSFFFLKKLKLLASLEILLYCLDHKSKEDSSVKK